MVPTKKSIHSQSVSLLHIFFSLVFSNLTNENEGNQNKIARTKYTRMCVLSSYLLTLLNTHREREREWCKAYGEGKCMRRMPDQKLC